MHLLQKIYCSNKNTKEILNFYKQSIQTELNLCKKVSLKSYTMNEISINIITSEYNLT